MLRHLMRGKGAFCIPKINECFFSSVKYAMASNSTLVPRMSVTVTGRAEMSTLPNLQGIVFFVENYLSFNKQCFSIDVDEKFTGRPLYLDAQATTPMVYYIIGYLTSLFTKNNVATF